MPIRCVDAPPIGEILSYLSVLVFSPEDLFKVTTPVLDGGCEIYRLLKPD